MIHNADVHYAEESTFSKTTTPTQFHLTFFSLGRGQERGNPDRGTQGGDPEG